MLSCQSKNSIRSKENNRYGVESNDFKSRKYEIFQDDAEKDESNYVSPAKKYKISEVKPVITKKSI